MAARLTGEVARFDEGRLNLRGAAVVDGALASVFCSWLRVFAGRGWSSTGVGQRNAGDCGSDNQHRAEEESDRFHIKFSASDCSIEQMHSLCRISWLGYPESNQYGNRKMSHVSTAFEGLGLLLFYLCLRQKGIRLLVSNESVNGRPSATPMVGVQRLCGVESDSLQVERFGWFRAENHVYTNKTHLRNKVSPD